MAADNDEGDGYIVVFEYTADAGGYEGIRTWTSYPSKEKFEAVREEHSYQQRVIAEGVNEQEAIRLACQTSPRSRLLAALDDATFIKDGQSSADVDLTLLKHKLEQAFFMIADGQRQMLLDDLESLCKSVS